MCTEEAGVTGEKMLMKHKNTIKQNVDCTIKIALFFLKVRTVLYLNLFSMRFKDLLFKFPKDSAIKINSLTYSEKSTIC